MSDEASNDAEVTSIRSIAADLLGSLILLTGTYALERLKHRLFERDLPLSLAAILTIGELTLVIAFVITFIRMLITLVITIKRFFTSLQLERIWESLTAFDFGTATKQGLKRSVGWGLLSAIVFSVLLIAAIAIEKTSALAYWLLLALGCSALVFAAIRTAAQGGPAGLLVSVGSFAVPVLVGGFGCLILLPFAMDWVAKLTGQPDSLQHLLDFLFPISDRQQ